MSDSLGYEARQEAYCNTSHTRNYGERMNQTVKGSVTKIWDNSAQGKGYNVVLDDGNRYGTRYKPKCDEGDYVTIEFQMNGQWRNIKKLTSTASAGGRYSPGAGSAPQAAAAPTGNKDKSIVRQVLIKEAVGSLNMKEPAEIVQWATALEEWALGGDFKQPAAPQQGGYDDSQPFGDLDDPRTG